jgi:hypothetical protein
VQELLTAEDAETAEKQVRLCDLGALCSERLFDSEANGVWFVL